MLSKEELIEYCDDARQNYLPHISIDCVVFGFHEGVMKVLVLKTKKNDEYYLPGGFLLKKEPIEMAADRTGCSPTVVPIRSAVCSSPSDSQAARTAAWRASRIAPRAGSAAIVFQKSKVTARIGIGANLAGGSSLPLFLMPLYRG